MKGKDENGRMKDEKYARIRAYFLFLQATNPSL